MYTRDLNADGRPELITNWSKGAVAERIQILSVDETQARVLLDEPYRIDATLIYLDDEVVDILITTGDGAEPYQTTHYKWMSDKYIPVGKSSHESLVSSIKKQFE